MTMLQGMRKRQSRFPIILLIFSLQKRDISRRLLRSRSEWAVNKSSKTVTKLFRSLSSQTTATFCSLQTSVRCIRQRLMILHRQRQAYSVTMLPQSLALMKAKMLWKWLLQKITRVCCSLLLKTARLQKFRLNPTQQRLTVKSSRAHIPTNLRLSDFSICLRTKRYSSRRHREICSLFTRVHSLSKQPVQHRVLPFSSPKKVTDFSA